MSDIEYLTYLWNLCPEEYQQIVLQLLRENAPVLESTPEQICTTE